VLVPGTQHAELRGVAAVQSLTIAALAWLYRDQPIADLGVDAHLEVVDGNEGTGRLLAVQIKSGSSFFKAPTEGGWWFRFDDDHAQYWLSHSLPVIVVLHDPDSGTTYWQRIASDTITNTGQMWKVRVPSDQLLDASARAPLSAIAQRPVEMDTVRSLCDQLPGDSRLRLLAAAAEEPRPNYVGELATLLTTAGDPAEKVAALLAETPLWLRGLNDAAMSTAWRAIAGYAVSHELGLEAIGSLKRAAGTGDHAGRWLGLAAIVAVEHAPEQSSELSSRAARTDAGAVLASIAEVLLATQRPAEWQLPELVEAGLHSEDPRVVRDAAVLRVIAEFHVAHERFDEALETLETALLIAPGNPFLQVRIADLRVPMSELARIGTTDADLARAERLAEAARRDFRRWSGPSERAAMALFRIRVVSNDVQGALKTATPLPDGEADTRETRHTPLMWHACSVAYRSGQNDLAERLLGRIQDAGARRLLDAVRDQVAHGATDEVKATWLAALDLAEDAEVLGSTLAALTGMGVWPITKLEQLRDDGQVSADAYAVLQARSEAASGDTSAAVARLREYAPTHASALGGLVETLASSGDYQGAAEACDTIGAAFSDTSWRLQAIDLWATTGRQDVARERAFRLLSRSGVPIAVKNHVRVLVLRWAQERRDWSEMAEQAAAGLEEASGSVPSTMSAPRIKAVSESAANFAWALIWAHYQAGRRDAAWGTWSTYEPSIRDAWDADFWLSLAAGRPWTVSMAERALRIADRFRDDPRLHGKALTALLSVTGGNDDVPESMPTDANVKVLDLPAHLGEQLRSMLSKLPVGVPGIIQVHKFDAQTLLDDLRQQFSDRQQLTAQVTDAVRVGQVPFGLLAVAAGRPTALAYAQRAAGVLPSATLFTEQVLKEIQAAKAALGRRVAVDISAIAVATLLPGGRIDQLRARFSQALLPVSALNDIAATRFALDQLARSSGQLGFHGGAAYVTELTEAQKGQLLARGSEISRAARAFHPFDVPDIQAMRSAFGLGRSAGAAGARDAAQDAPWLGAVQLAKDLDIPLWCDDAALRLMAAECGIQTFGTPILLHVLTEAKSVVAFTEARFKDDLDVLLSEYVVDLPLTFESLRTRAETDNWVAGAAAAVFCRPSRWADPGTEQLWVDLLMQVWDHEQTALPGWFPTAAFGVAATDEPAQVANKIAALLSLVLVRVTGVGPEPFQLLWPTALQSFEELYRKSVHRSALGTKEPATGAPRKDEIDADGAGQVLHHKVREALLTRLTNGEPSFSSHTATKIVDSTMGPEV
jgi:hypothetical protein